MLFAINVILKALCLEVWLFCEKTFLDVISTWTDK